MFCKNCGKNIGDSQKELCNSLDDITEEIEKQAENERVPGEDRHA